MKRRLNLIGRQPVIHSVDRELDEAAQYALRKLRREGKHKPPPTQEELDLAGYESQLAAGAIELNVDEHQRLAEAAERSRTKEGA